MRYSAKIWLLLAFLTSFQFDAAAQIDPRVFGYTDFVWFGLDFSQARFVGSEGFTDPIDIKVHYMRSWNKLILEERTKYDLSKAYKMGWRKTDLSTVARRNEQVDPEVIVVEKDHSIPSADIDAIIQDYTAEGDESGLGLVYIITSFNKRTVEGSMYVVFFDIKTHEIFWKREYYGMGAGFGLRNYWAKSILLSMRSSGEDFNQARRKLKN